MIRTFSALALSMAALGSLACSSHHSAVVSKTALPPPPGEKIMHTERLLIHVTSESSDTQCVVYEKHHPICFYEIREAVERGLARSLWPSFPEVLIADIEDAAPDDYVLQVDLTLDALPPDDAGPGWSAGARSRFRLLKGDEVLSEETLSSRSRAQFAYGAPLAVGATEVIDATVIHVATQVSLVPEAKPDMARPLPMVASRSIEVPAKASPSKASTKSALAKRTKPEETGTQSKNAKSEKSP